MHALKEHIVFKIITLTLVGILFVPTALKIEHIFEHHDHKVCTDVSTTHIHKVDLDCEFQKFQITTFFLSDVDHYDSILVDYSAETPSLDYKFLNKHKPLQVSLRGPPVLV